MKRCPFCAEQIQDAAIACKHCGRDIGAAPTPVNPAHGQVITPTTNTTPTITAVVKGVKITHGRQAFGFLLVIIGFFMTFGTMTAGFGFLAMWVGIGVGLSRGALARWAGGFVIALMLAVVGMTISGSSRMPRSAAVTGRGAARNVIPITSAASNANAAPAAVTYQLALLSSRGYESASGGYHYVEGQVRNASSESLENVVAVATWFDKNGNFIKSDDALIDFNPILPGQTSPFKTITSGNPEMAKYTVEFKTMFGGVLSVDDQRKK